MFVLATNTSSTVKHDRYSYMQCPQSPITCFYYIIIIHHYSKFLFIMISRTVKMGNRPNHNLQNLQITFNKPMQKYGHPYAEHIVLNKDWWLRFSLCWASHILNSNSWQDEGSISSGSWSKSSKSSCFFIPCCITGSTVLNVIRLQNLHIIAFNNKRGVRSSVEWKYINSGSRMLDEWIE